jgi:hypothetical protein
MHTTEQRLELGVSLARQVLEFERDCREGTKMDAIECERIKLLSSTARRVCYETGDYVETDVDKSFE